MRDPSTPFRNSDKTPVRESGRESGRDAAPPRGGRSDAVLLAEARAELERQKAAAAAGADAGAEAEAKAEAKADRKASWKAARKAEAKPALRSLPPAPQPAPQPSLRPHAEARRRPGWARRRHRMVLASFLVLVLLPAALAGWYLHDRAVDQYASVMAFSVRSEDSRSALDVLGRLGGGFAFGGGAASTDGEILHQFIQSQELVARIDARLDLRALYSRHFAQDPVFGFRPGGTIEDLTQHWSRKLRIAFDAGTGLMEIRVLAFDPEEARAIARAILEESTQRMNALSAIARDDATRHAREDLDVALERLRMAREAVTAFRIRTQIVDPSADLQGQMGLLNTLHAQLAAALIELDLLRENTRESDPRITQAERRIEVIRVRINEERARIGGGAGPGGEDYATVVAEFERLNLDREFAEQAYRSALSAYDAALAQAQRNSRYLATHVEPTLAESPRYPEREMLFGLTVFFLMLGWSVGVLIYYSVRDSR